MRKLYLEKLTWKDVLFGVFTFVSIFSPIIFVEINNQYGEVNLNTLQMIISIIALLFLPVSCITIIIYYFIISFENISSICKKILNIVSAYIIIILSFSSIYYFESYIGDYDDSISKYMEYRIYSNKLLKDIPEIKEEKNKLIANNYKLESQRAFKGIDDRLWSGVDYIDSKNKKGEVKFTDQIINNTDIETTDLKSIIKFVPTNRSNVYSDCLYFSAIAMTTVGFGDISPNLWYSKLTVIAQVFLGQALTIFSVGFFFYNLSNKKEELKEEEEEIDYFL